MRVVAVVVMADHICVLSLGGIVHAGSYFQVSTLTWPPCECFVCRYSRVSESRLHSVEFSADVE